MMREPCVFPWPWHKKRPAYLHGISTKWTTTLVCLRCGRTWKR